MIWSANNKMKEVFRLPTMPSCQNLKKCQLINPQGPSKSSSREKCICMQFTRLSSVYMYIVVHIDVYTCLSGACTTGARRGRCSVGTCQQRRGASSSRGPRPRPALHPRYRVDSYSPSTLLVSRKKKKKITSDCERFIHNTRSSFLHGSAGWLSHLRLLTQIATRACRSDS